ncbi:hypothetical protein BDP81DRAFT_425138 [Colletotrichum phormii]|uniref:Uncharacterized protein n=1 Tax=Colletotrichum phormii TaxID=359342 RepID=A0AAI9ZUR4_9PEZI|nr:uncharacterized protein BDP81DRAFT_425138 [Colletotrichum phormii]KAK1638521.1 hypothetical protein BDP81DRAFT_425138 [Colletotrichum phormii]
MSLSTEAIIATVALIVALPPTLFAIFQWKRPTNDLDPGLPTSNPDPEDYIAEIIQTDDINGHVFTLFWPGGQRSPLRGTPHRRDGSRAEKT